MAGLLEKLKRLAQPGGLDEGAPEFDILLSGRPGARRRQLAMAARFGLTAKDIDRDQAVAFDAAEVCAECRVSRRCQKALDGQGEMPLGQCPNAGLYRKLATG